MTRPRILSGMQPTGGLHLGNYLGALKQWAELVKGDDYDPLFCIVDAHAITIEYEPPQLLERVFEAAVSYIAGGLDPERCTMFVQSDVPQHMELAWYLSAVTPMGDLNRMTQFKEKSEQHKQNVNAGIFTYPVLMAADILIYKATVVPVGDDQVQHLELTREITRRFNARFGDVFPEPNPRLSQSPRIMGIDGKSKMSKSKGNSIDLFDTPKQVEKKIKRSFTDEQKVRLGDPGRPELCNIFTMHKELSSQERQDEIDKNCRSGELGCGECKKLLLEVLQAELEPIRERGAELRADKKRVLKVLNDGRERARSLAEETMQEVRRAMGMTTQFQK